MMNMKQLSSFMVLNINGGDRISYTFDEVNKDTGMPISTNNRKNFYVTDETLSKHIEAIRQYLMENKLSGD